MRIEYERQHSHHHPLVGFRRMPGDGDRMILIVMPVHVGNLNACFVDSGFESHDVVLCMYCPIPGQRRRM